MHGKDITAYDIANDIRLKTLLVIVVGHLVGRRTECTCCWVNSKSDEESDERIRGLLREMGFGETIARAQKDFSAMMDAARRERRWFGGPYELPIITPDGLLLRYLLEDAENVFKKKKEKSAEP